MSSKPYANSGLSLDSQSYKASKMVGKLVQKALSKIRPILWITYRVYLKSKRFYTYDKLKVRVHPSVFHPGLLFSTKIMYKYLSSMELTDKKVLELGAGSGMVALNCARKGAQTLASDINPNALACIDESKRINNLTVETIESDLFDKIPLQTFDYIIINPPYYQGTPKNDLEKAFYAGRDYDYFINLFSALADYINELSRVLMILSSNSNLEYIKKIAEESQFLFTTIHTEKKSTEINYIYSIQKAKKTLSLSPKNI